jgi:hypothetical protein
LRHVGSARGSRRHGLAVAEVDLVDHRRGGGDEVEVVLALEPLLDDLHVEQPEEAAAEPEAERLGGVGLERNARVVEAELLEGVAQGGVVGRCPWGRCPRTPWA